MSLERKKKPVKMKKNKSVRKRQERTIKKKHTRGPNNDNVVWALFLAVPGVGGREEEAAASMVVVAEVMCWQC